MQLIRNLNPNDKIWRYTDFPKFLDMLMSNSLFFSKLSKLQDPHEGKITHYDLQTENDGAEYLKSKWGEHWAEITGDATPERHKEQTKLRKNTIVNCWHLNNHESIMMWKLYSNYNYGISIQSTVKRLDDSIQYKDFPVEIRSIKYLDWTKEGVGKNQIFDEQLSVKRLSFKHEKEIRAIIRSNFTYSNSQIKLRLNKDGKLIPANLDLLIEKIFVSPFTKSWFFKLVKAVIIQYIPNKEVIQSNYLTLR